MTNREPLTALVTTDDDVERYRRNLQDEIDSAVIYEAMAGREASPELAEIYRRLGAVEQRHARFWRARLVEAGVWEAPRVPTRRARALRFLARWMGAAFVLPTVATLEELDRHEYDGQPETAGTAMPAQERSHARLLSFLAAQRGPGMDGATMARIEGRHRGVGGNALRAAVLGANDGLTSNLSLVMGVAGAQLPGRSIVITGLAGLLAGACSMAMGEYVSVQSSRELAQRQIAVEADELDEVPEEEQQELALIYEAKGLAPDEAASVAAGMMANRSKALDTLTREELVARPRHAHRFSMGRSRGVLPPLRGGRDHPPARLLLHDGRARHRREHRVRRPRPLRDRVRHHPAHRALRAVLGIPPAVPGPAGRRGHLRYRPADRGRAVRVMLMVVRPGPA